MLFRGHYRVLLGDRPGSFRLSTEDNGISLREFWRIVDCAEDLSWAVVHYAGAARSVGQSYTGSLLLSPDGTVPPKAPKERIRKAFEKAPGKGEVRIWRFCKDCVSLFGCCLYFVWTFSVFRMLGSSFFGV